MANKYTKDDSSLSNKIFFLNGENITHDLTQDGKINPIPSLKLVEDVNRKIDDLSGDVRNISVENSIADGFILSSLSQECGKIKYGTTKILSSYVYGLSDFVEKKIEDISYDVINSGNGIISALSQKNGKVNVTFKSIVSSDIVGLSDYVKSEIEILDNCVSSDDKFITSITQKNGKLTDGTFSKITDAFIDDNSISESKINGLRTDLANLSSNYVKKSGDVMDGGLVASSLSAESIIVKKNYESGHFVDLQVSDSGIKANLIGDKKVEISTDNGLLDVVVNGKNVNATLDDISSQTYDKSKKYVDDKIVSLSSNTISNDNEFIFSLNQENGIVTALTRKIVDSDIATGSISQNKILNLTSDLQNISSSYLLKADFDSTLSNSFENKPSYQSFDLDVEKKCLYLDVKGNRMEVPLSELFTQQIIDRVEVIKKDDGKYYIRIWFKTTPSTSIDISIERLAQVYKAGYGIVINDDFIISVDSDVIPNREYVESLDDRISSLEDTDWRSLKFNGHITNVSQISDKDHLSNVFQDTIFDLDTIYNGSFIEIAFKDGLSAKLKQEDEIFEKGDYLILHDHSSKAKKIDISRIEYGKTAFLIRGGTTYSKILEDLSRLSSSLYEKLSVTVELSDVTAEGFLSTYVIKQGGVQTGVEINIPKTDYTGYSSETITISVDDYKISGFINEESIGAEHLKTSLSNSLFNLNEDEIVKGQTFFEGNVSVDYSRFYDTQSKKLSDVVKIDDTFGGMYNGIVNIISECKLTGYDFDLSKPISSAFDTINRIAAEPKISVEIEPLDVNSSRVIDGFDALQTIITSSEYSVNRNLNSELQKIDNRFDVNEKSIATHTEEISALKEYAFSLESRLSAIEKILETYSIIVK